MDRLPKLDYEHKELTYKAMMKSNLQKKARILEKANSKIEEIGEYENKIEMIEIEINNYEESFRILAGQLRNENVLEGGLEKYELKFSGKCIVTLDNLQSKKIIIDDRRKTGFLQNLGYKLG